MDHVNVMTWRFSNYLVVRRLNLLQLPYSVIPHDKVLIQYFTAWGVALLPDIS